MGRNGPLPEEQLSRRKPGTGTIDFHSGMWRGRYRRKGNVITVYSKSRLECERKLLAVTGRGIMAEWEHQQKVRLMWRLREDLWQLLFRQIRRSTW